MRVEELMIGNWVIGKYNFRHPMQITSIWSNGVVTNSGRYDFDEIESIPLTHKVLEKNGFELTSDGWLWIQNAENVWQNYICIRFRHNGEIRDVELSFVNKNQCFLKNILYVHQFQNALRLCGINKEIIL